MAVAHQLVQPLLDSYADPLKGGSSGRTPVTPEARLKGDTSQFLSCQGVLVQHKVAAALEVPPAALSLAHKFARMLTLSRYRVTCMRLESKV